MQYKKTIIVEFNDKTVRLSEVQHAGVRIELKQFDVKPMRSSKKEDMVQAAVSVLKSVSTRSSQCRVIVMVARKQVLFRYLTLPSHDDEEIHSMVQLQLPGVIPYALDEVIWHSRVLVKQDSGYTKVLCLSMDKRVAQNYWDIMHQAGVTPHAITVGILGLEFWLQRLDNFSKISSVILYCDQDAIEIGFYFYGQMVFSRTLRFGWSDDFDQFDDLLEQLELTFESFRKEDVVREFHQYLIVGQGDHLKVLKDKLETAFQAETRIVSPVQNAFAQVDAKRRSFYNDHFLPTMSMGVSLVKDERLLNFVPQRVLQASSKNKNMKMLVWLGGLTVAALILAFTGFYAHLYQQKTYLDDIKQKVTALKEEAQGVDELQEKIAFFQERMNQYLFIPDVMRDLVNNLPETMVLTMVHLSRDRVFEVQGFSEQETDVYQLQQQLVNDDRFKDVSLDFVNQRRTKEGSVAYFKLTVMLDSL